MRAAALLAGTEQLALVSAFSQRADNTGASWLGMTAVLLKDKSKVLSNEF
jgi:hypothetical protein